MALLDVSEILTDLDLSEVFMVKRRSETVNDKGRSVQSEELIEDVVGVITVANPNDLERLDDSQRMGRNLSVVTKFRLIGPAPGKQPDLIWWQGSWFVVKNLEPYPQYGEGFVQAIVGSIEIIDPPVV